MRSWQESYHSDIPVDRTSRQALRTLTIYRLFVAALFLGLYFTPIMGESLPPGALATCRLLTGVMLVAAPLLYLLQTWTDRRPGLQILTGLALDIGAVAVATGASGDQGPGLGALLVVPSLLCGAMLPARLALLFAAAATVAMLWQATAAVLADSARLANIATTGILGASYFLSAIVGAVLARRTRESQAMVRRRSAELADLAELNEMVIERMRTGIMIIDAAGTSHLMNEAAWYLCGMPAERARPVDALSPELSAALQRWREEGLQPTASIPLAPGVPAIVPRFAGLSSHANRQVLVFLEDSSILARRAREITVASLGRLSASIAHEIRNPLGAISHSAQLLAESESLDPADRKLSEIVLRHCNRMNDIVENVLHLARQENTRPEPLRLGAWLREFLEDYLRFHEPGEGRLELKGTDPDALVLADAGQLQQVLWNLCENALKYGRSEDGRAIVTIDWSAGTGSEPPWIEVCDEGPGIPPEQRASIFEPFFTTSDDGSGLGLYLCQQLVEANQGRIRYECDAAGSRFRVELAHSPEAPPAELPGRGEGSDTRDRAGIETAGD